MNTIRAVRDSAFESPKNCVVIFGSIAGVVFGLGVIFWSRTLIDDLSLLLLIVFIINVVYLQPDYVICCLEPRIAKDGVIFRILNRQKVVGFTIDHVPLLNSTTSLEEILDVLKKHHVRCTFLVMSGFVLPPEEGGMEEADRERCLGLLRRAVAEGHELANHLQFDKPSFVMKPDDFDAAFEHCDQLIASLQGGKDAWEARPRRWYRPPSGVWTKMQIDKCKAKGYTIAIGNCFPHDVPQATRCLNAPYLCRRVREGAIVIIHDRWHTPQTLETALPRIKERGLKLVPLSEAQATADAEDSGRPAREPKIKAAAKEAGSEMPLMDFPAGADKKTDPNDPLVSFTA